MIRIIACNSNIACKKEQADCNSSQFRDKEHHAMANILLFIQPFLLCYSDEIKKNGAWYSWGLALYK